MNDVDRVGGKNASLGEMIPLYEKHGEKGLIPKPKGVSADPELRIKVVKGRSNAGITCELLGWKLSCGPYRLVGMTER